MLKTLDLFSGIGGFSLGLERTGGFETVAFCEIDPFCREVLKKHWPEVEVYEDVRKLDYTGSVDVICGGFPCQPFSVAGKQKGAEDDRHLWPAMFSLIQKHRPRWVIGENVAGFINMALDDVLAELESEDYECRVFVIPACAINAPHRRDRVWIVGHTKHNGSFASKKCGKFKAASRKNTQGKKKTCQPERTSQPRDNEDVAYTKGAKCQKSVQTRRWWSRFTGSRQWCVEPNMGRVADGVSRRVDRIKALGNAVIPQIPEIIGHAILEAEGKA